MKKVYQCFLFMAVFTSAISSVCYAQEISTRSYEETKCLPRCPCDFTLKKLPNSISHFGEKIFTRGEGTETCSIGLKFSKKQNYDHNKFTVSIYDKSFPLEEVLSSSGFKKNKKNKWQFIGNSRLLQPKKFTFLKTTKIEEPNEIILIGEAIEDGYISKGPMSLNIYEIVRATPEFYVVTEIVFDPDLPNPTANNLISDLVKVMKSINGSFKFQVQH